MIAALIGVPLGVALFAMGLAVAAALSGISIDASRWRDAAAQRASAALGRPVILQGAFELEPRLGRELGLRIGSLRILNPPGFAGQEFLAIGELRAGSTCSTRCVAGCGRAASRPAMSACGSSEAPTAVATGRRRRSAMPGPPSPAIDIARIALHGLDIHYHDVRSATRRFVQLDELSGSAGRDRPLHLAARGRLEPATSPTR